MSMLRKSIVCVCILFLCAVSAFSDDKPDSEKPASEKKSASTVSIEQALKTSYVKDKEQNTEIIRFSGNVILSVIKENKKTLIRAETVNFDRKRDVLFASGDVVVERYVDGKLTETISAETVLFNTVTLEGVFTQGRAVQKQQESLKLSEGSSLIVASELFAKDRSDAVAFKKGMITFCGDENPHWKIKAHRIWLLPGNEFAFANALLYVGVVPVMYFPFFYYPKDELVFNPSFGYRPREGYFIQTTTYIMGRKPLESDDTDSKGFNFMKPSSLKKQQLDGLILRNLDSDDVMPPYFLKFMADYYTTLGAMVGIAGEFKPKTAVNNLSFNIRIGFSNTVYPVSGYTQYISYSTSKQKRNDYGWLFGAKLPFRYAGIVKTDVRTGFFSLALSLPLYSDPQFDKDFADRKENMDWIDFFLKGGFSGGGKTGDVASATQSKVSSVSSYTWNVSGSYVPQLPQLQPYIQTLSVSSFTSSIVFAERETPKADFENDTQWYEYSPNRRFFYPSQIKPLAFSVNFSGTLVQWPAVKKSSRTKGSEKLAALPALRIPENLQIADDSEARKKNGGQTGSENVDKNGGEADSGKQKANKQDGVSAGQDASFAAVATEGGSTELTSTEADTLFKVQTLPDIAFEKPQLRSDKPLSYKLGYSIKPDFVSLFTYSAVKADGTSIRPADFSAADPKAAEIVFKSPLDINSTLALYDSFVSVSNTFGFSPQYQTHPILSSLYSAAERDRIIVNDYSAQKLDILNTNALTVKPLLNVSLLKDSSVSWNTGVKFLRSNFIGTVSDPQWKYDGPSWDEKGMSAHNLNFTVSAKENGFSQTLSVQTNLPPLVDSYTGNLQFVFPIGSTGLETGYKKNSRYSERWYFNPLVQSSSWNLFSKHADGSANKNKLSLSERFQYNIEDKHPEKFSTALSWRGLRFAYEMAYSYSYTLNPSKGWEASKNQSFLPYSISASWNITNFELTDKRKRTAFKPSLSTIFAWNMVKPTDSYFSFNPSATLKIKDFLDVTFSAESRNGELLRYFQKGAGLSTEIPGEQNIFLDLYNSFAFWDEAKRNTSGFKIKRLSLKVEHDLHDWVLASEFKVEPRIVQQQNGKKYYDYKPYFSLSVLWKPMKGLKTVIEDEYGTFTLNPAKNTFGSGSK